MLDVNKLNIKLKIKIKTSMLNLTEININQF